MIRLNLRVQRSFAFGGDFPNTFPYFCRHQLMTIFIPMNVIRQKELSGSCHGITLVHEIGKTVDKDYMMFFRKVFPDGHLHGIELVTLYLRRPGINHDSHTYSVTLTKL